MNNDPAHRAPSWSAMLGTTLERRFVLDAVLPSHDSGPRFAAWDLASDARVHVHFCDPAAPASARARFAHEVALLQRLPHPNLPDLYGHGDHEGMSYVAVEALDGESLATILEERERLTVEEMVPLAAQLLAVAGYAHARDVLLRDFTPRNIILCQRRGRANVVKLASVARAHDSGQPDDRAAVDPRYCSPEALKGEALEARSDVYALGVLFFRLIAGRCPFEGDEEQVARAQLFTHPPRLEMLLVRGHSAPNAFLRILRRALEKDPWDRPRDAGGLAEVMFDCFPSKLFVLPPATPELDDDATTGQRVVAGAPEPVSKDEARPRLRVVGGTEAAAAQHESSFGPKIDYREWDDASVASTMAMLGFDDVEPPSLSALRTDALAWLMVSATQGDAVSGMASTPRAMPVDAAMARLSALESEASAMSRPRSSPPSSRTPTPHDSSSHTVTPTRASPPPTMSRGQIFVIIALAGALAALVGATAAFLITGPRPQPARPIPTWSEGLTRLSELEPAPQRPAAQAVGYLSVIVPAEATVRIDGQPYEPGPVQAGLSPGSHSIAVTSPTHALWEGDVTIGPEENRVVHPMLVRLQKAERTLEPVAEDEAPGEARTKPTAKAGSKRAKRHRSRASKRKRTKRARKHQLLEADRKKKSQASSGIFLPTR